ncbi:sensor histidine kinase [Spongiimicrobium salis]|uniref:sensor histidine kinase n=1 Tax=Spongiimicrobium salis TaxID=1667022 RepID=UPI00374DC7E7
MDNLGGYPMSFPHELTSLFFKMTISYFLYLWFFPRYDKKRDIIIALSVLILNASLYEYADRFFHTGNTHFWKHFIANLLTYISFGIVFFTIYSVKNLYKKQLEINILAEEKKYAEMQALKAQINPHFLFNTLNTIYANALKKDDKTPELILKLSDGFRYVLHEGQQEFVALAQEIKHLKDYINLQQERLSDKVDVHFSVTLDDPKQEIAPLLCIGFIENAFKYSSMLKGEQHPISIAILLAQKTFSFHCKNAFNANLKQEMDVHWADSGVGIHTTKKRLELLYPGRHTLDIVKKENEFEVVLTMEL